MQMTEVMTLPTSVAGHAFVKRFCAVDLILHRSSTGKLFDVAKGAVRSSKPVLIAAKT